MKIIKMTAVFVFLVLVACNMTDSKETYWEANYTERVDKAPFRGFTSIYMVGLAEANFLLSTKKDSIFIQFPVKKEMNIDEFQSFTNARIESGKLLDSIYNVERKGDQLLVKFHYIGTGAEDDRFVFKFQEITKAEFEEKRKSLEKRKQAIMDSFKPLTIDSLALNIPIPSYQLDTLDKGLFNPFDFAQDLTDDPDGFFIFKTEFKMNGRNNENLGAYHAYFNMGMEQINKISAQFNGLDFEDMGIVTDYGEKKVRGYYTDHNGSVQSNKIQKAIRQIDQIMDKAELDYYGLPHKEQVADLTISEELEDMIALQWKAADKTVKLLIELDFDQVFDENEGYNGPGGKILPLEYTPDDIREVFLHYTEKIDNKSMQLFVIDNDFAKNIIDSNSAPFPSLENDLYGKLNYFGYYDNQSLDDD